VIACRESGCRNDPVERGRCEAHVRLAAYEARDARRARGRARNRDLEMPAQIARISRQLPALARHMATIGDVTDLPAFVALQREMDQLLVEAVTRLHDEIGYSWTEVGQVLGVSRQAARQRFADKAGLSADRRAETA